MYNNNNYAGCRQALTLEGCFEHFEYLHCLAFCENNKQYLHFKLQVVFKKIWDPSINFNSKSQKSFIFLVANFAS